MAVGHEPSLHESSGPGCSRLPWKCSGTGMIVAAVMVKRLEMLEETKNRRSRVIPLRARSGARPLRHKAGCP